MGSHQVSPSVCLAWDRIPSVWTHWLKPVRISKGEPDRIREDFARGVPEAVRPEEPTALVAFLASPAAGYLRGTAIAVDGGRMRSI